MIRQVLGRGKRFIGRHLAALGNQMQLAMSPTRITCPVCTRRILAFKPIPEHYLREQAAAGFPYGPDDGEMCNAAAYECPNCGASDRDRLCAMYLSPYLDTIRQPSRLIEFAPSPALSTWLKKTIASKHLPLTHRTADLFAPGVDDRVDLMNLSTYADRSVDFFICSHVLEHVPDDRKALAELYRILKPGGGGILLVPIVLSLTEIDEDPGVSDPKERWRRFGQDDHVRLYSRSGFLDRISGAGFSVQVVGETNFGVERFREHGITPSSVLYIVSRPAQ